MDPRFGGNFGGMNLAGQFRYGPSFGAYEGGLGELTPQEFLPQFLGKSGREMPPPPASFDPNDLYYQPQNPLFQPGGPQFLGPFKYEQQRDRFILNDPRSGVAMGLPGMMMAGAPRYIRSSPPPNIINKAPDIDSRYIDNAIKRRWQPLPAPLPRGPQLPGFV